MYSWEIDEDLDSFLERMYKIKQENQVLKAALRKVLNSVKSLRAQCNVAIIEIDQFKPTFAVDTAIKDRLVDRISLAISEHFDEICFVTARPSLADDTITYSTKINLIGSAELEQLVKLLGEKEEHNG